MFKIVSYAYSQNVYSSRKIEKACKRDINFRWLLQGYKAPDHATISRFRKEYLSNEVIKDLSKTDTDATFMHMKDDHMRNGQLKPAYNVQIAVESEYVTGVGIFKDRNDIATLIPMLNNMQEKIGHKYLNVIADSGYESEENYLFLEANNQIPYIKPQTYQKWKKRSFKNDISKRENMKYDAESDTYICNNDKKLVYTSIIHRKSVSGYKSEVTVYECENCDNCTHKVKCTKAKGNRKM